MAIDWNTAMKQRLAMAEKERDEARAESEAHLSLQRHFELRTGKAEAACAELRAALEVIERRTQGAQGQQVRSRTGIFAVLDSTQAGAGWVSPEEAEKLRAERDEAQKKMAVECKWEACGDCASCLRDQWLSPAEWDELEKSRSQLFEEAEAARAENERLRAEKMLRNQDLCSQTSEIGRLQLANTELRVELKKQGLQLIQQLGENQRLGEELKKARGHLEHELELAECERLERTKDLKAYYRAERLRAALSKGGGK